MPYLAKLPEKFSLRRPRRHRIVLFLICFRKKMIVFSNNCFDRKIHFFDKRFLKQILKKITLEKNREFFFEKKTFQYYFHQIIYDHLFQKKLFQA